MKELNLDEQIKVLETGIARMQGQLELLLALKQAGAAVWLPAEPVSATPAVSADDAVKVD